MLTDVADASRISGLWALLQLHETNLPIMRFARDYHIINSSLAWLS